MLWRMRSSRVQAKHRSNKRSKRALFSVERLHMSFSRVGGRYGFEGVKENLMIGKAVSVGRAFAAKKLTARSVDPSGC